MWSTAESQTLRIPSIFADQKYSIKLKSSENFSFFVCTVQILWPCEVSKNRDLVIFWKVSEFCSHFQYALSQRWTTVGLWNYSGWVSVKSRWGKTKSKNIIMVTWPFRGFQKCKKISIRNTFTKYITQISMQKLQAKSPSLYFYENRPRKLHRQWIWVNFYFSILICYLLKSDHRVMVPILSHRNPHVGPFFFQNFLVQKLK